MDLREYYNGHRKDAGYYAPGLDRYPAFVTIYQARGDSDYDRVAVISVLEDARYFAFAEGIIEWLTGEDEEVLVFYSNDSDWPDVYCEHGDACPA